MYAKFGIGNLKRQVKSSEKAKSNRHKSPNLSVISPLLIHIVKREKISHFIPFNLVAIPRIRRKEY